MTPTYRGYYLCLDKNGVVQRVSEHYERGGVTLSWMDTDAVARSHAVMKGRQPTTEIVVVYGFRKPTFISASMEGGESEKQLIEKYKKGEVD